MLRTVKLAIYRGEPYVGNRVERGKALEHQLTPGDVVLFLAYLDQVYAPIGSLTELYTSLQEHASSMRRAHRLLAEPEAPGEYDELSQLLPPRPENS